MNCWMMAVERTLNHDVETGITTEMRHYTAEQYSGMKNKRKTHREWLGAKQEAQPEAKQVIWQKKMVSKQDSVYTGGCWGWKIGGRRSKYRSK